MSVNWLRILYVDLYNTVNELNPEFMNNIFKVKENKRLVTEKKLNRETLEGNQVWSKMFESAWTKDLEKSSFSYQIFWKSNHV